MPRSFALTHLPVATNHELLANVIDDAKRPAESALEVGRYVCYFEGVEIGVVFFQ